MRSGQSLSLADLNLKPGQMNAVRITLVYPADATPGHLLSVVPEQQLAQLQLRQSQQESALAMASREQPVLRQTPPPLNQPLALGPGQAPPVMVPPSLLPDLTSLELPPSLPASVPTSSRISQTLLDRYQQAVEAQRQFVKSLMGL